MAKRKKKSRKIAGKAAKRAAGRKVRKRPASAKVVKRELKTLRKGLKKEITLTKRVGKKASRHDMELAKLKKELAELARKPGTKKKQLSEYNLFIRRHLKAGKTFKQAVALWKKSRRFEKRALAKKKKPAKRKVKRRVKRKPARKPKRKRKTRRKAVKKPKPKLKRKKVRKKPKIKTRTITRTKRIVVEKPVFPTEEFGAMFERVAEKIKPEPAVIRGEDSLSLSDEEVAYRIVNLYFQDIARLGVKRGLSLDEIINAYLYALERARKKEYEMREIVEAVKRSKLRTEL